MAWIDGERRQLGATAIVRGHINREIREKNFIPQTADAPLGRERRFDPQQLRVVEVRLNFALLGVQYLLRLT